MEETLRLAEDKRPEPRYLKPYPESLAILISVSVITVIETTVSVGSAAVVVVAAVIIVVFILVITTMASIVICSGILFAISCRLLRKGRRA